jgi:hypothetical protein
VEISPVSSFAVWNNNLYSSSLYYAGIFILNQNDGSWASFTKTGLPTNYSLDVEKLIPVNQTLFSVQGENGTFYTFNPTINQWNENYYFSSSFTPGISVEDMIYDQKKFLASTGRQLIYSSNGGSNWSYDTVGLKNEIATGFAQKIRVLYAGINNDYVLSNMAKGGTWVQQRGKSAIGGTTWATGEEFLQLPAQFYSYSIRELNNIFFIGTDNGLYIRKS